MNQQSVGVQTPKLKPVSELFKEAWAQYSKHFNELVSIMLISGIGLYLQTIFLFTVKNSYHMNSSQTLLALLATIIYIVGLIWGLTAIFNRATKLDQPMSVKQAFLSAKPFIAPMLLVGLITGVLTMIGFVLLVIPGIIVAVWLSFSYFIVIEENKRGTDALKASKAYVEGYWWPVFGRLLLIGVVIGLFSGIIGTIGSSILGYRLGMLVQDIISLGLIPFAVLYQYDLYKNIKSVKSGVVSADSNPVPLAQ